MAGFALAATVSLVLIAGCAPTRTNTPAPTLATDPWPVHVEPIIVSYAVETTMGVVVVTSDARFLDPEVFELEDDIIPEVITARKP